VVARITIIEADLTNHAHQRDVVAMTKVYAQDVMGNDGPLSPEVLERLIPGLREIPTALIFLAYCEGRAVGIATCFWGFTTFAARPLVNIHDFCVVPELRGSGVGRALLAAVEQKARERGCAKVTLEVQENNTSARQIYEAAGFSQAVHGEAAGGALFYAKKL
jgi:GNAT superfamily N-acetyltransferase